jgi:hypothetical protein
VRQKNYLKDKVKDASGVFLYELVCMDVISSTKKVQHIGQYCKLPESEHTVLIVNCMLPKYEPKMLGKKTYDGEGVGMVMYFVPTAATVAELAKPEAERSCSVRLMQRFLATNGDGSPTADVSKKNFKGIARVNNLDTCGLGSTVRKLVGKYNETPFLIKESFSMHSGKGYVEVGVDVHKFSFLARKGLYGCHERIAQMVCDFAFVVQGNTADELPEQM